jgi:hypothetical protein
MCSTHAARQAQVAGPALPRLADDISVLYLAGHPPLLLWQTCPCVTSGVTVPKKYSPAVAVGSAGYPMAEAVVGLLVHAQHATVALLLATRMNHAQLPLTRLAQVLVLVSGLRIGCIV